MEIPRQEMGHSGKEGVMVAQVMPPQQVAEAGMAGVVLPMLQTVPAVEGLAISIQARYRMVAEQQEGEHIKGMAPPE